MNSIHILGAGAVGWTLAASLIRAGRPAIAVRVSRDDISAAKTDVTIRTGAGDITAAVPTVSLARLDTLDGLVVITTKSPANQTLAATLAQKNVTGPLVILQNGAGVEDAFLAHPQFAEIHRCVLYMTAQTAAPGDVTFRWINPSPIGLVRGDSASLAATVATLHTDAFPFRAEPVIAREVWRKTIINAVFNSLCPLLDVDNGIFARDESVAALARTIVREGLTLARAQGIILDEPDIMEQILRISRGSDGVLISTLQDLRHGRETEIEYLNLGMARIAARLDPPVDLRCTELLGRLILAKSRLPRP